MDNDLNIQDIHDLNKLMEDQISLRVQWSGVKNALVEKSCEVLKLKNQMDILAGHLKDNEELVRVKKLEINIKPR